jgi:RNA polymerase sigma factor (sigma-70 family)
MTIAEYNQTVDTCADGLFRFIVKNLRNEEQSRDIVQDTFAKLWMKVDEVSYDKSKSYLFTTGYRTMIDWIRREKKRGEIEKTELTAPEVRNDYSDLQAILHEALNRLPEKQKHVVMLRDYEGYSYEEIGEITDLSLAQVKVYIYRARVALKTFLVSIDNLI